ncbi:hypothetical protein A1Q1_00431 [Trichosporon asahii var. asahii CBS 2479]|uniref:Uncharacterized protein n=1 Tax=Trichosporon asahii var. asahii (strain ATCC 90039 / CBS 2479 / JCM 2466 / KCTC 7840 / NBRC 103889/ NCYC 2677 / UAMH 7654) TaxID=1186058 RepID=J5TCX7_TRIAS|nr:hypothetical protein A1Q1_00431 [Trichosporon asahii var. asahii CBS 2479]EJT50326.1 hypothetical protein A1Q1_00431 [Trichosporon asahii var. asahii CBS 2479]
MSTSRSTPAKRSRACSFTSSTLSPIAESPVPSPDQDALPAAKRLRRVFSSSDGLPRATPAETLGRGTGEGSTSRDQARTTASRRAGGQPTEELDEGAVIQALISANALATQFLQARRTGPAVKPEAAAAHGPQQEDSDPVPPAPWTRPVEPRPRRIPHVSFRPTPRLFPELAAGVKKPAGHQRSRSEPPVLEALDGAAAGTSSDVSSSLPPLASDLLESQVMQEPSIPVAVSRPQARATKTQASTGRAERPDVTTAETVSNQQKTIYRSFVDGTRTLVYRSSEHKFTTQGFIMRDLARVLHQPRPAVDAVHLPFPKEQMDRHPQLEKNHVSLRVVDSSSTIERSQFDPHSMCVLVSEPGGALLFSFGRRQLESPTAKRHFDHFVTWMRYLRDRSAADHQLVRSSDSSSSGLPRSRRKVVADIQAVVAAAGAQLADTSSVPTTSLTPTARPPPLPAAGPVGGRGTAPTAGSQTARSSRQE